MSEISNNQLNPRSATSAPVAGPSEGTVEEVVCRFREAYDARDIDAAVELFAEDADWTLGPGTFTGKEALRRVLEWDVGLSPASRSRESGIGMLVKGNVAVTERVVEQTAEGIPFVCPLISVFELNEDGKIQHLRSFYDKLAIIQQVAREYPGVKGWFLRRIVNILVAEGEKGLARPSAAGGGGDATFA
jgi:ketosteroid isomerase-like protein